MTVFSEEVTSPSERLLRHSLQEETEVVEAYAAVHSTLRAYVAANAYANSSANAIALSGSGMQSSIHAQFFDVDNPCCVVFAPSPVVSASSLSRELKLMPGGCATVRVTGDPKHLGRKAHALSLFHGGRADDENEVQMHFESAALTELVAKALLLLEVECVNLDVDAVAAMDDASAEYRSRRTRARAEERRLRRHDRE